MEFAEQKSFLFGEVVRQGYAKPEDIPTDLLAGIPSHKLQRWFEKFYASTKLETVPASPRLVNHFALGADPEFAFSNLLGEMQPASNFGLQAGLAFGMDNNGRLVELRPAPNKFALAVVASILSELRWLALTNPGTRECHWICKPYFNKDGLGGHVHFGRKRTGEIRDAEIRALDLMFLALVKGGVFNQQDVDMRRQRAQGAMHGEHYGALSQIREQSHGYEYRTMPTWLDSPWLTYLVLVLSKLVVHDPELILGLAPGKVNMRKFVRNLLAFYKPLDDDALIAYNALNVFGFPQQTGQDFRAAWGIQYPADKPVDFPIRVEVIPGCIEPTFGDLFTIFECLRTGRPIYPEVPKPNWEPTHLPQGYAPALLYTNTLRRPGLGELLRDLAVHKDVPVVFNTSDYPNGLILYVPKAYPKELLPNARTVSKLLGFEVRFQLSYTDGKYQIYLGDELRDYQALPKVKKLLLSGFLPIWKMNELRPESYTEWSKRLIPTPKSSIERRLRGKEITQEVTF